MNEQVLLGYIGDIDGNDGNLVAMDAVAEDAEGALPLPSFRRRSNRDRY